LLVPINGVCSGAGSAAVRSLAFAPRRLASRIVSVQFAALAIAASAIFAGSPSAVIAAVTIDPINSQLVFPLQRTTASTISPADSRRTITAACVMAAAALRRFRTAAQTAPRNSVFVALFSVFLAGSWSAIISDAVISAARMAGERMQNPVTRRMPQNMSTVRLIIGGAEPQAGARNGFIGN